jgi:electron transfer flavoprotein alpha subunit
VSAARALGALSGAYFDLLLLGAGAKDAATALKCFGAANIYYSEDTSVTKYTAEAYASAVATVVWEGGHKAVMIPSTPTGNDLTDKLARLMNGAAVSSVTAFKPGGYLTAETHGEKLKKADPDAPITFITIDETAFEPAKAIPGAWEIDATEVFFEVDDWGLGLTCEEQYLRESA